MTDYLLDANVFIQAKNLHYGFDFCPAFWDWLVVQNEAGKVASIERVGDELRAGDDALADWAMDRADDFFLRPDDTVIPALGIVSNWASGSGYQPAAVATLLQVADYWLVAHALAHDCTVVTHEVPADTIYKIKIPNACIGLGLRCVNPYDMLRLERARFVLGSIRQAVWCQDSPKSSSATHTPEFVHTLFPIVSSVGEHSTLSHILEFDL